MADGNKSESPGLPHPSRGPGHLERLDSTLDLGDSVLQIIPSIGPETISALFELLLGNVKGVSECPAAAANGGSVQILAKVIPAASFSLLPTLLQLLSRAPLQVQKKPMQDLMLLLGNDSNALKFVGQPEWQKHLNPFLHYVISEENSRERHLSTLTAVVLNQQHDNSINVDLLRLIVALFSNLHFKALQQPQTKPKMKYNALYLTMKYLEEFGGWNKRTAGIFRLMLTSTLSLIAHRAREFSNNFEFKSCPAWDNFFCLLHVVVKFVFHSPIPTQQEIETRRIRLLALASVTKETKDKKTGGFGRRFSLGLGGSRPRRKSGESAAAMSTALDRDKDEAGAGVRRMSSWGDHESLAQVDLHLADERGSTSQRSELTRVVSGIIDVHLVNTEHENGQDKKRGSEFSGNEDSKADLNMRMCVDLPLVQAVVSALMALQVHTYDEQLSRNVGFSPEEKTLKKRGAADFAFFSEVATHLWNLSRCLNRGGRDDLKAKLGVLVNQRHKKDGTQRNGVFGRGRRKMRLSVNFGVGSGKALADGPTTLSGKQQRIPRSPRGARELGVPKIVEESASQ